MKADWTRLESFHLRCQRRILGIKWSDFITNAEVCIRSGLQSIRWFAGAVFLCSATLHLCRTMYRQKQFCAWRASSVTEFHPSQTGADRWVVLAVPDLFRLQPVSWRRPQLCPGLGRVENVRYVLFGLAFTTMMTCYYHHCHQLNPHENKE